jgi:hypothetical protein
MARRAVPPTRAGIHQGALVPYFRPRRSKGALRSQDLRTRDDPFRLNASILRLEPSTGAPFPGNPLIDNPDLNARRIVAYGLRNPFRHTTRPGTNEIWVGDVGWNRAEEIDRVPAPADRPADNLGWPCYEGRGRRAGYDGASLAMCENLYTVKMAPARMLTSQTDTKIRWCRGSRARRAIPRWLGWPSTGAPLTRASNRTRSSSPTTLVDASGR